MANKKMHHLALGNDVFEIVDKVARSGNYITITTAAEMTNTSAIYVYTGTEEGYNAGHLYYWDGTAFVDGGEYNAANVELDATLSVSGKAADAKATGDAIDGVRADFSENLSDKFTQGNNLFVIPDYEANAYGMTISIKDNKITLKGKNTTAIRLKLTHGIDLQATEQVSWASESLSDMFTIGEQYCIAYKVYSGNFSTTIGTPARVSKTPSVSFLSTTVPKNIATADNMPHYIMLYVPLNTTADVTFEPFFMRSYTSNDTFRRVLTDTVKVSDKLTPENEFNYFTVDINKSLLDSAFTSRTVQCVVTFPDTYKAQGVKTPLVMYCHGRTDTVAVGNWVENDTDRLALIRAFTSAGYAVFDVDSTSHPTGGAVDVGCPELMQSYIKALDYIQSHYNVDDRIYIYSLSFGTFAAMNMLCWYPSRVRTACLSAIRASLQTVFERGTPYNTEIATNFGFEDTTGARYESDKVLGYDPYGDIVSIEQTNMLLKNIPPIKALTSSSDTLELTEAHNLISALKASGNAINWKEVTGLSHNDICYLVDSGLRSEVIMWFNRFR